MGLRHVWGRRFGRTTAVVLAGVLAAVGLVAVTAPAQAATPVHVQSRGKEITTGTLDSLKFTNNNVAGNLIVVYVVWSNTFRRSR